MQHQLHVRQAAVLDLDLVAETGPWVDQDIKVCYYGMSTLPEVWKGYRMSMGEEEKGGSQFL